MQLNIPVDVVDLLPVLDGKLLDLLTSLTPDEWQRQTIAKLWSVKDVAAHLLDGNIRLLSILRDSYFGESSDTGSDASLIGFLNRLNADWVQSMKRVSPQMLLFLLQVTGPPFCQYFKSLNPGDKSVLSVDWAGEQESRNWMEIAREYTEKWLHQQQIRDAVGKPGLMTRELFHPFIDIFMLALPHTYRSIAAETGTLVKVTIPTAIGGSWFLEKTDDRWILVKAPLQSPTTQITIDPDIAWKLFSKSLRQEQAGSGIQIQGNQELGQVALTMVSVMA